MTRDEARIIAARVWLNYQRVACQKWPLDLEDMPDFDDKEIRNLVYREVMLIRRRLQRLANPKPKRVP